jgi:hypothetical protein
MLNTPFVCFLSIQSATRSVAFRAALDAAPPFLPEIDVQAPEKG